MKRLGIMGGTFDPPHKGHIYSATRFYDIMSLDELLIIPDYDPPHKTVQSATTPLQRLEMCKVAFSREQMVERNITVSDYEIAKGGESYTYLTLEHFKTDDNKLFLFCGEDMFLTLDEWKKADRIFALSVPVCCRRESSALISEKIRKAADIYNNKYSCKTEICSYKPLEMSSTAVRLAASENKALDSMLTRGVSDYIENHGLYGNTTLLAKLREDIKSVVGKRYNHIISTEEEVEFIGSAAKLAPFDLFRLRIAALLHDITHEMPIEKQLEICNSAGFKPDREYILSPATLHSQSGAVFAKMNYPAFADDFVYNCISSHTVGKENMNLAEKILCLADYIEKTRKYDECIALRKKFYDMLRFTDPESAINTALIEYFVSTQRHCLDKGEHLNSVMIKAREYLEKQIT